VHAFGWVKPYFVSSIGKDEAIFVPEMEKMISLI